MKFFFFSLECNGGLSDETRIRMSLVRIMFNGRNIQTGAYSNICRTIFTLGTDDLKVLSYQFLDRRNILLLMTEEKSPHFVAINGLKEQSNILQRIDEANEQINLMVSSFTKKALFARIIKTRLLC